MSYLLQFDGGSRGNPGKSCGACVIFDPSGKVVFEGMEYMGKATNNQAEYTGLLIGLQNAFLMDIEEIRIEGDSKLVISQIKGLWKVNNEDLKKIYEKVMDLLKYFKKVEMNHIYRDKNKHADRLSNEGMDKEKSEERFFE